MLRKLRNSGFTIIEVVLVLAVAGLIFLIVFMAVPALQRSVRDKTRMAAANETLAQLEQYHATKGHYPRNPAEQAEFATQYKVDFTEPRTGMPFSITYSDQLFDTHNGTPVQGQIWYTIAHWCAPAGSANLLDGDDVTNVIVVVVAYRELDNPYCIDNYGAHG